MAVIFPYAKQSWTDGVSNCSAARNLVHEDGIFNAHNAPAVRVYHNATQTLTTAVETALAFNTEIHDQAGGSSSTMHDTVTNNSRLTAIYAGVYHISGSAEFVANATGQRWLAVRVNGTASQYLGFCRVAAGSGTIPPVVNVSVDISLAVNDYVQLIALQDSGGNLNVSAGTALFPALCQFMMHRVA